MSRWRPGDTVVLRYFMRGALYGALPTRAIATDPAPVLWLPPGTPAMRPSIDGRPIRDVSLEERFTGNLVPVDHPWTGEGVLVVGRPGREHSIWLFWRAGAFAGWYVQLEDAWRPSTLGFDSKDHELDIWVGADGEWRWKDEDELEAAVAFGAVSADDARAYRAEGERVLEEWPFPTGWEEWRPDPSWPLPTLPAEWRK